MSENANLTYNELTYHHLSTAQIVDGIQILDERTTIDEIIGFILNDAPMWYYDGVVYHLVIAFKDRVNSLTIYFSNSDGSVSTVTYGGE
jgi:hypothetical protein